MIQFIRRVCRFIREEFWRMFRFGIIGTISWLIYFLLYALFSRILWTTGNRTLENFIAICLSAIFNFSAHRHWTFRSRGDQMRQFWRYVVVIGTASLLETLLFWFGQAVLHWYDFWVAFWASAAIAFYTFAFHRFYTFHHHPADEQPSA